MKYDYIRITVKELRAMQLGCFPEYEVDGEFTGSLEDSIVEFIFKDNGELTRVNEILPSGSIIHDVYWVSEMQERGMGNIESFLLSGFTLDNDEE